MVFKQRQRCILNKLSVIDDVGILMKLAAELSFNPELITNPNAETHQTAICLLMALKKIFLKI